MTTSGGVPKLNGKPLVFVCNCGGYHTMAECPKRWKEFNDWFAAGVAKNKQCICPTKCDCESPDTNPGLVSEHCPIHNYRPRPVEGCPTHDPD